jgi:hypothetical protein
VHNRLVFPALALICSVGLVAVALPNVAGATPGSSSSASLTSSPAAGKPTAWTAESVVNEKTQLGDLLSTSCWSRTGCIAVGWSRKARGATEAPLAMGWDGNSWTVQNVAMPEQGILNSVSCVSSSKCFAVGSSGTGPLVQKWNGSQWVTKLTAVSPQLSGSFSSISCVSASFCTAIGEFLDASTYQWNTLSEIWNGQSWTTVPIVQPEYYSTPFSAVTCLSSTWCQAIGDDVAAFWNGTGWATEATPSTTDFGLDAITCVSEVLCFASGARGSDTDSSSHPLIEEWDGASWTVQSVADPPNLGTVGTTELNGISCLSSSECLAVGMVVPNNNSLPDYGLSEVWNGSSWTEQPSPDLSNVALTGGPDLTGASCARSICVAVGYYSSAGNNPVTVAESWNGSSWTLMQSPNVTGAANTDLNAVSCSSAHFCMAVGDDVTSVDDYDDETTNAFAEIWNGTSWAPAEPINPTGESNTFTSVSCPSSTFCVAVGTDEGQSLYPLLETWDGSTWMQIQAPLPQDIEFGNEALAAVSCSSGTSCTVVGSYESSTYNTQIPVSDVWDGTTWAVVPMVTPDPDQVYVNMESISCFGAMQCMAVGVTHSAPDSSVVEEESATGWTLASLPSSLAFGDLWDISCPSANFCAVAPNLPQYDSNRQLGVWNGSAWTTIGIPQDVNEQPSPIACISSTSCLLAAGNNTADEWNGTTWTSETTAGPAEVAYNAEGITAISCLQTGVCMAVATQDVPNPEVTGPGLVHAGYAFAEVGPILPG